MQPLDTTSPTPAAPENQLFVLARSGKLIFPKFIPVSARPFIEHWIYPFAALVFAFFVPILSSLLGLPLMILGRALPGISGGYQDLLLLLVAGFLPIFVLIWVWLYVFEGRSLGSTGLQRPFLGKYLRGMLVGVLMIAVVMGVLAAFGYMSLETAVTLPLLSAAILPAFLLFLGWMVQGAAEELLARGFLFPIFGIRFGVLVGMFVSSVLFAFLHLNNPGVSPIAYLNLALFGVFTCLYAIFEGGLWGVCAIHAIWNWAQGNLFGIEVSGVVVSGGVLMNFNETGPDWLTGGTFGPEGGLAVSAILVLSILFLWLIYNRKTD